MTIFGNMKRAALLNSTLAITIFLSAVIEVSGQGMETDTTSADTTEEFTPNAIEKFEGATSDIEAVAISPDGKILAAGGWDKKIYLYSLDKENFGAIMHVIEEHSSAILSIAGRGPRAGRRSGA